MSKKLIENPTQKDKDKLWKLCTDWIKKQEVSCPESIYQMDSIQESFYEFADKVAKVTGYFQHENNE